MPPVEMSPVIPEFRPFPDRDAAVQALTEGLVGDLTQAISERGQGTIAVSGGRTPELVFPLLSNTDLDWSRIAVTLIDERWVEPEHPDSNEGLARRLLHVGSAAQARMVGLKSAGPTPDEGKAETEDRLASLSWPLDTAFLGMGEDGHVASLFPNDGAWVDALGRCLAVSPQEGRSARMSLTPAALLEIRHLHLIVLGAAKRHTLEAALEPGPAGDLPIRLVLHQNRVPVTVYLAD